MKDLIFSKTTLGLNLPTDPVWAELADGAIEDILTDHAFCELKAASSCISIIQLFPNRTEVVEALSPVVTEEWGHFRLVLMQLKKRGLSLGKQRKDEYALALKKYIKKGGSREQQLVEMLLMCAMIEARSCERFKLLTQKIKDEELQQFYYDLMIAEASHYKMFLALAKSYLPENIVMDRWKEWLEFEANLMLELKPRPDRMH